MSCASFHIDRVADSVSASGDLPRRGNQVGGLESLLVISVPMREANDARGVDDLNGRDGQQVMAPARGLVQVDAEAAILLDSRVVHTERQAEGAGQHHVAVG